MKWAAASLIALASVAGLVFVPTAGAQVPEVSAQTEESDAVHQAIDNLYSGKAADALAAIDSLLAKSEDRERNAYLKALRGLAFLALKKPREARIEFEEGTKLAPASPDVDRLRFIGGLDFGAREQASIALDRLIAVFPDVVHELPEEHVWAYLRMKEGRGLKSVDDQRIALAQIGFAGNSGDYLAMHAAELLIERGRLEEAKSLIPYIDNRSALEQALIQKKFAPIWQTIESHAGPGMSRIEADGVRLAQVDFDENPGNPEKLNALIEALREARRYKEAIELGGKFAVTPADIAKVDEQGAWAINGHALALYSAKRFAEGDARFAALNAAHDEYWIVSMKINRLEALVLTGRYAEADRLMAATEAVKGSDYAAQLVRRLKLCTLHRLGRTAEAKALLAEVKAKAEDAPAATIDGLLCIGDLDTAEKIVLETLAGDKGHDRMLTGLQRRPLSNDDPSEWREGWQKLRARPAVSAAFDKVGRDLPDSMYPAN